MLGAEYRWHVICMLPMNLICEAVADPGFPVGGGVDLVRGAVDPRGGYVSKILHVKTKESGPVGGGRAPGAPPPRSANARGWNVCVIHALVHSNHWQI